MTEKMDASECPLITNKCESKGAYKGTHTHTRDFSALGSKAERNDATTEGELSTFTNVTVRHGLRTSEFMHPGNLGALSSLKFFKHSAPPHLRLLPG